MEKIISGKSPDGEEFSLYQLRILEDNFTYILAQNGVCLSIDPGAAEPVLTAIKSLGLSLDAILITHFHEDHIAGAPEIKEEETVPILGPKHKDLIILDQIVADDDEISLGPFSMEVIHAPGHTMEHVMFFFRELKLLFCGDVLFLGGCGKMFEGNEHHYFHSLEKLRKLPSDTVLLTGHDYNIRNLQFIQHLDQKFSPDNFPEGDTFHTLKKELSINPFLKAKTPTEFREIYDKRELFRSSQ